MGKLMIVSGLSGVGREPLLDTFETFIKTAGGGFVRHVLSADQAIDLKRLKQELSDHDYVLLENCTERLPLVKVFCADNEFPIKQVFLTPFSERDFYILGCDTPEKRTAAVKAAVLSRLTNYAKDMRADIENRADVAFAELESTTGEVFVNPYGEENAEMWHTLQTVFGSCKGLNMYVMFMDFVRLMEKEDAPFVPETAREKAQREAQESEVSALEAEYLAKEARLQADEKMQILLAIEDEY